MEGRKGIGRTPHDLLELCLVGPRDGVPLLGGAKVDVVDAVEVHVLEVPREGALPHAQVEVGGVDAGQLLAQAVEQVLEPGDVPGGGRVLKQAAGHVGAVERAVVGQGAPVGALQLGAAPGGELVGVEQAVVEVLEGGLVGQLPVLLAFLGGPATAGRRRGRLPELQRLPAGRGRLGGRGGRGSLGARRRRRRF